MTNRRRNSIAFRNYYWFNVKILYFFQLISFTVFVLFCCYIYYSIVNLRSNYYKFNCSSKLCSTSIITTTTTTFNYDNLVDDFNINDDTLSSNLEPHLHTVPSGVKFGNYRRRLFRKKNRKNLKKKRRDLSTNRHADAVQQEEYIRLGSIAKIQVIYSNICIFLFLLLFQF